MNRTQPGRAHKNLGRTAHFLPKKRLDFCQPNYRPNKNTKNTPKDQDVLATHRTERGVEPKSHYQNILSDNKYHKRDVAFKKEVKKKVPEINHGRKAYKYTDRYLNRTPYMDKRLNLTYHELSNVDKSHTERTFTKELRNNGVNPVAVKLHHHPLTHENLGKGTMILNSNSKRADEYRAKIETVSYTHLTLPTKA